MYAEAMYHEEVKKNTLLWRHDSREARALSRRLGIVCVRRGKGNRQGSKGGRGSWDGVLEGEGTLDVANFDDRFVYKANWQQGWAMLYQGDACSVIG